MYQRTKDCKLSRPPSCWCLMKIERYCRRCSVSLVMSLPLWRRTRWHLWILLCAWLRPSSISTKWRRTIYHQGIVFFFSCVTLNLVSVVLGNITCHSVFTKNNDEDMHTLTPAWLSSPQLHKDRYKVGYRFYSSLRGAVDNSLSGPVLPQLKLNVLWDHAVYKQSKAL